ncbi:MAG: class I SAM-dependent methyltransferase [Burkholderiaceae bacterium]|jgi:SAM-dependent methyltransferase|nr:class I SAM-dependent methyltransferase [Burkholderiaceae bacterium]
MTGLYDWVQTPAGQHAMIWERAQLDAALADVFGYHALQLGLADMDALAANRMPHRWLALGSQDAPRQAQTGATSTGATRARVALVADPAALPFPAESLDLVVLPHTLELSRNPHASLREVQRVLVHEGKVAITGINPLSLWGFRQWRARQWRRLGLERRLYLPDVGEFISPQRLRDWLRLLEFEVESIAYGCWQPAVRSVRALERFAWLEKAGRRWYPFLGAAYCVLAVKRTQGATLVGPAWLAAPKVAAAPVSIAGRAGPARAPAQNNCETH